MFGFVLGASVNSLAGNFVTTVLISFPYVNKCTTLVNILPQLTYVKEA